MVGLMPVGAVQQRMEQLLLGVVRGHGAVHQGVDGAAQVGVGVENIPGVIGGLHGIDLIHGVAEDILVLPAGLLRDLHIGAVQRTQRYGAVEHQLHVAGAGGFRTGRGDLLGNVGGGDDMLGVGAVVVLNEYHFQLVGHGGVAVDQLRNPVDIADDGLCPGVAGGGLGAKEVNCGMEVRQAALLQAEVDVHDGQNVHQLALVLVQTLDLHVEDEVGVQRHALVLGDDGAQLLLLQVLDVVEFHDGLVVNLIFQLTDEVEVLQEVAAHLFPQHGGQFGVAQTQPAAGGDAVGLILEPLGEGVVPVLEAVVLQNLGVDLRHAVDIGADVNGQVRHVGGVVFHDEQIRMLPLELLVNAADDVHDLGNHAAHQIQRPLFQCLAHDGVVGVGEGLLSDIEGVVKAHALQHQQADQLGDGHGGMGVVELHRVELGKAAQIIAMGNFEGAQHILQGRRGQHILLLDAQALALPGGVVGVQDAGDVLGLVLGVQRPQVVLIVEGVEVQLLLGLALPQAQCAHVLGAVADDGNVVGNGQNGMVGELDLHGVVIAAEGPGVAELCPVVGVLHLTAVGVKALLEQTELVAQAVAGQGNIGGSSAVQEAGRQTAKTAVAQSVVLDVLENRQVNPVLGKQLLHLVQNAQVEQVGIHQTADQVLGGDVVGLTIGHTGLLGMAPIVGNGHHNSLTQRFMQLLRGCLLQRNVVGVLELCLRPFQDVQTVVVHVSSPFLKRARRHGLLIRFLPDRLLIVYHIPISMSS